ncbi:hypothetical protein TNCV_498381 [Trichonephila clavipes]|nr:hypothetical protein TNCV_498381 [Trichonephila clavipes]
MGLCGSPVVKVLDHGRHVMSSSPVPLKTDRVGQRCTLNMSRAQTSSRWCGVVSSSYSTRQYLVKPGLELMVRLVKVTVERSLPERCNPQHLFRVRQKVTGKPNIKDI